MNNVPDLSSSFTDWIAQLQTGSAFNRMKAIEVLGGSRRAEAVQPLIDLLIDTDSNYSFREAAAIALGNLEDKRAIVPLISAAADRDGSVRLASAKALEKLEADEIGLFVLHLLESQTFEKFDINNYREQVISSLEAAAKDSDVRRNAILALGKVKKPEVGAFIFNLLENQKSTYLVGPCLFALGRSKYLPAIALMIKMLSYPEKKYIRLMAEKALGLMKNPTVVESLIPLLTDPDIDIRIGAVRAIGNINSKRGIDELISCLGDSSPIVRVMAARSLMKLGETDLANAYLDAITGNPKSIIEIGKKASILVRPLVSILIENQFEFRMSAATSLGAIWKLSLPFLFEIYTSADDQTQVYIRKTVGFIQDPLAIPLLIQGFTVDDFKLREIISLTIFRVGDPAIPAVISALKNENELIRIGAALTLKYTNDTRYIPDFKHSMSDKNEIIQEISKNAIIEICETNQKNISQSWKNCLCSQHLTKFTHIAVRLNNGKEIGYHACRICHRSDFENYFHPVSNIIVVLEKLGDRPPILHSEKTVWVTWSPERGMFDFTGVEVRSGAINDEEFVLQVINDIDPERPSNQSNRKLPLIISSDCRIKQDTYSRLVDRFRDISQTS